MTGSNADDNMDGFEFPNSEGTWHVVEDDYPALAWEDTDPFYEVTIEGTNEPIDEGDTLDVTTEVTNLAADGDEQTIELLDFDDDQQDSESVALDSGDATEVTLEWETETSDAGTDEVTVTSDDDTASEEVTIETGIESIDAEAGEAIADGEDEVEFTVTVEDANDDPIEGVTVEVTDSEDVSDLGGIDAGEEATTDGDGQATFTATSTDTGEFAVEFSETDAGSDIATSTFVAGVPADISLTADPADETVTADGQEPITYTATVEDSNDNPIEGVDIEADATDGTDIELNNDGDETTEETDDSGEVTVEAASETAQEDVEITFTEQEDSNSVNGLATFETEEGEDDEPFFEVGITDSHSEVTQGDEIVVEYDITNVGEESDTQDIEFSVNDSVEETETGVNLGEDETFDGSFTYTTDTDDVPELTVEVASEDEQDERTVTVTTDDEPAFFDVEITDTDSQVSPGDTINVDYAVENTGDETGTQDITFEVDDAQEDVNADVSLAPTQSVEETFTYETDADDVLSIDVEASSDDDSDSETITVEEPDEPFYAVEIDEAETDGSVDEGDVATVVAEIENTGDEAGDEQTVEFEVDGTVEDNKPLELNEGESERLTFSYLTDSGDVPSIDVEVSSEDDRDETTVGVAEAEAVYEVEITNTNSPVEETVDLVAEAEVENTGDGDGNQLVTIEIEDDGAPVDMGTELVELGPGETTDVTFVWETAEGDAGDYTVNASTEDAFDTQEVRVQSPEVEDVTGASSSGGAASDISVGVGITVDITGELSEDTGRVAAEGGRDGLVAGENAQIEIGMENQGVREGTAVYSLVHEGETVERGTVSVMGYSSETVSFGHTLNEGSYEVRVGQVEAETDALLGPAYRSQADVSLLMVEQEDGITVSDTAVESFVVEESLEEEEVDESEDGEQEDDDTGDMTTEETTADEADDEEDDDEDDAEGMPGFTAAAALVAMIAAAVFMRRQS